MVVGLILAIIASTLTRPLASIKLCCKVTSSVSGCLSPYQFCQTKPSTSHSACTSVKTAARRKYNAEHQNCDGRTVSPCYVRSLLKASAMQEDGDNVIGFGTQRIGSCCTGERFESEYIDRGGVISKLEVWADGWTLRGIKVTYSTQADKRIGTLGVGHHYGPFDIDVANGEVVTSLSIWGNGAGTRCGAFRIETSKGREFFPKMTSWGLKREYPQTVGSGVMLGLYGRSGADIDQLGFVFLYPISFRQMSDLSYDIQAAGDPTKQNVFDETFPNPSAETITPIRTISETKETSWSWDVSVTFEYGGSITVQAGIPEIADVGAESHWSISATASYSQSGSDSRTISEETPMPVPPKEKMRYVYFYYKGHANVQCSGTACVRVRSFDGHEGHWCFEASCFYRGVSTSRVTGTSSLVARWDGQRWVPVTPSIKREVPESKLLLRNGTRSETKFVSMISVTAPPQIHSGAVIGGEELTEKEEL